MENGGSRHCDRVVSKTAYNALLSLVVSLHLSLSCRYNAQYGLAHVMEVLMAMCKTSATAHKAVDEMHELHKDVKTPTSKWFLGKLGGLDPAKIERICEKALADTIRQATKRRLLPKIGTYAIDFHKIPFTGRTRDDNVVPGKPKGGTSRFERYASLMAVSEPHMPQLAVRRLYSGTKKAAYVLDLVAALHGIGLRVSMLLLDKEFCTVDVMQALSARGVKFLIAVSRNDRIKVAIDECKAGKRKMISRYTMGSGKSTFTFWLIIRKKAVTKKGKKQFIYVTFATNVPRHKMSGQLKDLLRLYRKRWSIENGYKSIESARARTQSRNHAIRTFLFYFSLIQCNLWYLEDRAAEADRGNHDARRRSLFGFVLIIMSYALTILRNPDSRTYFMECKK